MLLRMRMLKKKVLVFEESSVLLLYLFDTPFELNEMLQ